MTITLMRNRILDRMAKRRGMDNGGWYWLRTDRKLWLMQARLRFERCEWVW